jgi:hypothetical protein
MNADTGIQKNPFHHYPQITQMDADKSLKIGRVLKKIGEISG